MDIRSMNQGGQPALELNVSAVGSSTNIQRVEQEQIQVNTGSKDNQQSDTHPTGSGQAITEKDVKKAVDKLNTLLEDKETHAEYELYGRFKDLTIRIVNDKTKEVIQELPPRKIIDMIDKLCELAGMFVDKKA